MGLKENLQRLDFSNCNISEIIKGISDVEVEYTSISDVTALNNRTSIYNCFIYSFNADVLKTISNQSDNGMTSITDIKNDYKCVIVSFTSDEIMDKFKELHELNLQHKCVLLDCADKMHDFISSSTKSEPTADEKDEIKKSLLFVTRHQLNIKASDSELNDRYITYIKNKISPENPTTEFDNELKELFENYEKELFKSKYRVYIESNSSLALLLKDLYLVDDVVVEYVDYNVGIRTNYYISKNTLYLTVKWGDVCFTTLKLDPENVKQSVLNSVTYDLQLSDMKPSPDFTVLSDEKYKLSSTHNLTNKSDFISLAQKIFNLNPTQVTVAKSSNEKSLYKIINDIFINRVMIEIHLNDSDFEKFENGNLKLFNINPVPQTVISASTFERVLNPYYNSAFDLFHILGGNVEISDFIRNEIVGEIHNRVIDNDIFEVLYSDVYNECDTKLKITDGNEMPTLDLLYEDNKFVSIFNFTNDFIKKYSLSDTIFDGCLKDKTKDDIFHLIHSLIVKIHTVNCKNMLDELLLDLETKSSKS